MSPTFAFLSYFFAPFASIWLSSVSTSLYWHYGEKVTAKIALNALYYIKSRGKRHEHMESHFAEADKEPSYCLLDLRRLGSIDGGAQDEGVEGAVHPSC